MALLWKEGVDVRIQTHSRNHINAFIDSVECGQIRFIGFYGFPKLHMRSESWNILLTASNLVREDWVIGGDFNEIIDDAKNVVVAASQELPWKSSGR